MTQEDKTDKQSDNTPKRPQPNNPLHGITLKEIVTQLHSQYGWQELAERIPVRCFQNNPSIKSSLTFLRKTPWAREKVEELYIQASQNWGKYKKQGKK
ncbi:VF530 family protein [Thiomicrorhabdus sp. ZW0627]|uniref:VF530 family protein n=1 Tax=Thiomicrorhabdus sp. ZW0627 TaxID=3039774 RepID=UPI0024369C40|nr:VF530 family protein [Thiomicrorhabdus sp. ZW0627]MDG6772818.1 VF530 family protein [Thiomicrorhabdus sp. ZW0627]